MGRAKTQAKRGTTKIPALPTPPKPSPAQNIQNFDGRVNTNVGGFETQATRGTSEQGMQVNWLGIVEKQ